MKVKLLVLNLLFLIYSLLFIIPEGVTAQSQNPTSEAYYNTNPDVPNNMNTHVQSVFINVASTLSCILSGVDPVSPEKPCLGIDPATKKLGYVENSGGGLIGITSNMIAFTYNIPVNSHDYGSYLAGNFGIAKPTYAQGVGFQGLDPVLDLWEAFRNITYIVFVVLFVIIGLGIMFRIQIDQRTVMTLQNQIPKIIVALILVTFSYAIAGLLIDLMYVSMYVFVSIFANEGLGTVDVSAGSPFGAIGGIGGMSGIAKGVAGTMSGIVASIFDGSLGNILSAIIGGIIGNYASGIVPGAGIVSGIAKGAITLAGTIGGYIYGSKIIGLLAGVITYLIIIIALFAALLRLWFVLIKSYIYILLGVVFAPFYIAKGLIPGQSGFGGWIRTMVANLAVFPVTIILFLIGKALVDGFSDHTTTGVAPFIPPLVGDFADPGGFSAILGLAIVLMAPEVANMTKEALKSPDFKYSSAVGKGLGVGAGVFTAPAKGVGARYWGTNPITGEPRFFTKEILNRFGRGTNFMSKTVRGLTGTGRWYSQNTSEGQSEESQRQRRQERAEREQQRQQRGETTARQRLQQMRRNGHEPGSGSGTPPPTSGAGGGTTPPPWTSTVTDQAGNQQAGFQRGGSASLTDDEIEQTLEDLRAMREEFAGDEQMERQIDSEIRDFEARLEIRRGTSNNNP